MKEIGQKLREARQAKGLSLDKVAEQTRIRARYLQALEDGNFSVIPGPVYVKGFLKSYAAALGINANELLTMYEAVAPKPVEGQENEVKKITRPISTGPSINVGKIIVSALVIAVIGGVGYFGYNLWSTIKNETIPQLREPEEQVQQNDSTNPIADPNAGTSTVTPDTGEGTVTNPASAIDPTTGLPIDPTATGVTDSQTTNPTQPAANGETTPTATTGVNNGAAVPTTTVPTTVAQQPAGQPASTTPVANTTPAQTTTPVASTVVGQQQNQLELIATGVSWLRVVADDKVVYTGQMNQGEKKTFTGKVFNVRIGNAEAIKVSFNGVMEGPYGVANQMVDRVFGE